MRSRGFVRLSYVRNCATKAYTICTFQASEMSDELLTFHILDQNFVYHLICPNNFQSF